MPDSRIHGFFIFFFGKKKEKEIEKEKDICAMIYQSNTACFQMYKPCHFILTSLAVTMKFHTYNRRILV